MSTFQLLLFSTRQLSQDTYQLVHMAEPPLLHEHLQQSFHLKSFSQGLEAVILLLQPTKLGNPRILRLNQHPWDEQVVPSQLSECRNRGTKSSTATRLEMSEPSAQCCNSWPAYFIAQNRSDTHQCFPHRLPFSFSPGSCHIAGLGWKQKYWIFSAPSIPKFKNNSEYIVQTELTSNSHKKKIFFPMQVQEQ